MTDLFYYPPTNQRLNQIAEDACGINDDKAAFVDQVKNSNHCILSADSPTIQRQPIIIPGKNSNI